MKRVTGIGGLFFKCRDPEKTKQWYKEHLDLPVDDWGATFGWRNKDEPEKICYTAWSPFPADTDYFGPSKKEFMFNYRVEIVGEIEEYEYAKLVGSWISKGTRSNSGNLLMINFSHD